MKNADQPLAVILGDIDMLRPLALAGIPCVVCADRRSLPRYSRYAQDLIEWSDPWLHPEKLVDSLMAFASDLKEKPVLFYESDADLLMISRNRDRLSEAFRFVVPDPELTEDLVDKQRFHHLADRLGLPVPKTVLFNAGTTSFETNGLNFPVIAKPLTRKVAEWSPVAGLSKAVSISDRDALREFGRSMASKDIDFLAQELIPGEESEIESYHVYVDAAGETVGEFTGKKIRTFPREFGQSCALTISDAEDVAELGRELVNKLDLRGLAKFDFKRTPEGRLVLLEVNPRFNLWHHLGTVAGVNLPMLVYCDLVGLPRPEYGKARPGTNWCRLWQDIRAAREEGIPLRKWLPWAVRCEAKPGIALDDPLPLLRAFIYRTAHRRGY